MVPSRLGRVFVAALLAVSAGVLAQLAPATNVAHAAAGGVAPVADAWVSKKSPDTNYGTFSKLRTAAGSSEAVLRFRTEAWIGQRLQALTLNLNSVTGNPAGLSVYAAANAWKELTVTWPTRPSAVSTLDASASPTATGVNFDASGLFPDGVVDRNVVSLLVRNSSTDVVSFGARESTTPPTLSFEASTPSVQPETLKPLSDTWADSTNPSKTHGSNRLLYVDGKPGKEAFLTFDVSAWQGSQYSKLELRLQVGTAGGPGLSVYRVGGAWSESDLTWLNRPTAGTAVTTLESAVASGQLKLDLKSAFTSGTIETRKLSLKITTAGTGGFDFSSREGTSPPELILTPKSSTPTPSPSAAPTATAKPTASPTAPPTPSPTAPPTSSPTPPPTAPPTASPTLVPSPTVCPTPVPLFYFDGRGTDHGVGMSQQGARGRAAAGQTYDQILSFYYTGVDFTTIDGTTPVRVLLSDDFTPTATMPARVSAYLGSWQSAAFPGMTFPQGSYVELWPPSPTPRTTPSPTTAPQMTSVDAIIEAPAAANVTATPMPTTLTTADPCGTATTELMSNAVTMVAPLANLAPVAAATPAVTPSQQPTASASPTPTATPDTRWVATAYDSLGTVLATARTNDLVVEAIDTDAVLEMRFRDELAKYRLYRGKMRLLVTPTGIQAINVLPMESYLRGVVPAEVPATWPLEAVKTQAVAARTYAWSRLKGADREWDVVPTAANQVYGGYQHEHPNSDRAVLGTQNLVLTYNGRIISALYHANAGGHTEHSEYAFVNDKGDPGTRVPYLRGKPDVDENGVPYEINSGTYSWHSGTFTMAQLSRIMGNNALTDVGTIHNMTFHRGVSGRVYKVVLEGSKGIKEVSGGKFKNTYNNFRTPGTPNMVSTLFFLTPVPQ